MAIIVSILLAGLLAVPPPAAEPSEPPAGPAGPGQPPPGRGFNVQRLIEHVAQELNATEEQVKQLEAIAQEHTEAAQAMRGNRETLRAEHGDELDGLRKQMRQARQTRDRERVQELRQQIRALRGETRGDLIRETHEKIAAVLTEEQRAAFEEMTERHRQGMRDRAGFGEHAGRRHGPGERDGRNVFRFTQRVIETVDATQEQETQLRAITAEHVRAAKAAEAEKMIAMAEHRDELEALRDQAQDARRAGDEEALKSIEQQVHAILGPPPYELLRQTHDKMSAMLTDEQKVKFDTLADECRARMEHRARNRKGPPGEEHGPACGQRKPRF